MEPEAPAARPPLPPTVGTVRAVDGASLTVEVPAQAGGTVSVRAAAVHHAAYAPGDSVLVLFTGEQAESALVAGRVGELADAFAAANVLARLREVDGAGSGLDADTLDGSHAAAFLPLSGGTLTGLTSFAAGVATPEVRASGGAGLTLADDAGALGLHVADGGQVGVGTGAPEHALSVSKDQDGITALQVQNDSTAGNAAAYVRLDAGALGYAMGLAQPTFALLPDYAGYGFFDVNTAAEGFILSATKGTSTIQFRTGGRTLAQTRVLIAADGRVGIGTGAPQGRLHVHDGSGGLLFATRSGINATAQTIVPNGAGDVTTLARVEALVSNGSAALYAAFTLDAAAPVYTVAVGSDGYQFRRNADGSLDVRRTAGTNAGTAALRLLWM